MQHFPLGSPWERRQLFETYGISDRNEMNENITRKVALAQQQHSPFHYQWESLGRVQKNDGGYEPPGQSPGLKFCAINGLAPPRRGTGKPNTGKNRDVPKRRKQAKPKKKPHRFSVTEAINK